MAIMFFTIYLVLLTHFAADGKPNSPLWKLDDAWTECSEPCGPGVIKREAKCYRVKPFRRGHVGSNLILIDDTECDPNIKPQTRERACNLGQCNSHYRWRPSAWDVCSYNCGPNGRRTREVKCVYRGEAGDQELSDLDANHYCPGQYRPHNSEDCNQFDCPPRFESAKWEMCKQTDECQAGKQTREVYCMALLANGVTQKLEWADCMIAGQRPLPTWRKCVIPEFSAKCKTQEAEIEEAPKNRLVQMAKEGNKITLQVGEEGWIMPSTRVTVKCPVKFYSSQDLVWLHESHGKFTYLGHSKERVHVDKEGNLLIKNFKLADKGSWYCIAGSSNSTVKLMAITPAEAYSNWVDRHHLFKAPRNVNETMMNEDPKIYLAASESQIRWVEGEWSKCNIKCGEKGFQTRTVRCEELQFRVYRVLDDSVCESKHLQKPTTSRECQNSLLCPQWKLVNVDKVQCTNNCVAPGKGTRDADHECFVDGKVVDDKNCQELPKPVEQCENHACQLEWWTSSWSECSKTCGGVGLQSRTMKCIWKNSLDSNASKLCMKHGIQPPQAVQTCETGPCDTDCVDLSKVCRKNAEFCKMTTYRYHCCKSCRELFNELRTKPNKR